MHEQPRCSSWCAVTVWTHKCTNRPQGMQLSRLWSGWWQCNDKDGEGGGGSTEWYINGAWYTIYKMHEIICLCSELSRGTFIGICHWIPEEGIWGNLHFGCLIRQLDLCEVWIPLQYILQKGYLYFCCVVSHVSVLLKQSNFCICMHVASFGLVNWTDGAKGYLNDIVSVIRFG